MYAALVSRRNKLEVRNVTFTLALHVKCISTYNYAGARHFSLYKAANMYSSWKWKQQTRWRNLKREKQWRPMNSVKDDVVHFENLSVGSLAYLLLATEGKVNSRRHNTYNKEKNRKRRRVSLKGKASWIYPVFVHSSYQMPLLYREEKGRSSIWNLLVTAELWATRENSKKVPKRSSSRIQVLDDPLQRAHTNAV